MGASNESDIHVVTDDAVAQTALALIREAKEYVVLVSPYNAFWTHLKNEITFAIERKVRVTAIYNPNGYSRGDGVQRPQPTPAPPPAPQRRTTTPPRSGCRPPRR